MTSFLYSAFYIHYSTLIMMHSTWLLDLDTQLCVDIHSLEDGSIKLCYNTMNVFPNQRIDAVDDIGPCKMLSDFKQCVNEGFHTKGCNYISYIDGCCHLKYASQEKLTSSPGDMSAQLIRTSNVQYDLLPMQIYTKPKKLKNWYQPMEHLCIELCFVEIDCVAANYISNFERPILSKEINVPLKGPWCDLLSSMKQDEEGKYVLTNVPKEYPSWAAKMNRNFYRIYRIADKAEYPGTNLAVIKGIASLDTCVGHCLSEPSCRAVSYFSAYYHCHLKMSYIGAKENKECTSALLTRTMSELSKMHYVVLHSHNLVGTDDLMKHLINIEGKDHWKPHNGTNTPDEMLNECIAVCAGIAECKAVTLLLKQTPEVDLTVQVECYLKSNKKPGVPCHRAFISCTSAFVYRGTA